LVCLGHDQLFDPAWTDCRRLVDDGRIGQVQHVEAHLGYSLSGPFGAALRVDPRHWVRHLPGGLFQNTVSHPLYKITDFLTDQTPAVWADWRGFGSDGFPSELRLLVSGSAVTGWLFFSSRLPAWHRTVRVYGSKRMLDVDFEYQLVREAREARSRGPFTKIETAWRDRRQAGRRLRQLLGRFRRAELHYFTGMERLLRLFYDAIQRDVDEPPVPYRDARRVTWIMEEAFRQCAAREPAHPAAT
jgi:predicted dehydrogenase